MPGGDRKGPGGSGPKTGRGLGYCADKDQPGFATDQSGRAFRRGFGRGFRRRGSGGGWRNRSNAGFGGRGGRGALAIDDQKMDALNAENRELRGLVQQLSDKLDKLSG